MPRAWTPSDTDTTPPEGYWKASDGHWYSPDQLPSPPGGAGPRRLAVAAGAAVVALFVGFAAGSGSGGDNNDRVATSGDENLPSTTDPSPGTAPVLRITTTTRATTTTAAPTTTTTVPARAGVSRNAPVPAGQLADVGDGWSVTIVGKTPNATSAVLAQNQFNDPPKPGEQFYIVRVKLRRTGATPEPPSFALSWKAVGASNVGYAEGSDDSCGVIPDDLSSNDIYPGGEIEGNVCWAVSTADATSLVMYIETAFPLVTTYFAL